jgi:hypothetical protein
MLFSDAAESNMTNLLKSRSCLECGDELLKREAELCERCADKEIDEEILTREQLKKRPPIVNVETM